MSKANKRNKIKSYFSKISSIKDRFRNPFGYEFIAKQMKKIFSHIAKMGGKNSKEAVKLIHKAIDEKDAKKYDLGILMLKESLTTLGLFNKDETEESLDNYEEITDKDLKEKFEEMKSKAKQSNNSQTSSESSTSQK